MEIEYCKQLCRFYGVESYQNAVRCESIQINEETQVEWTKIAHCISHYSMLSQLYLFVALDAYAIWERRATLPQIFSKRFGLSATLLAEKITDSVERKIRVGVLRVPFNQIETVLKVLFEFQYHSFAAITDLSMFDLVIAVVMNSFEQGVLSESVLHECCNQIIANNGVFLHILGGNDGFSVNQLYAVNDVYSDTM